MWQKEDLKGRWPWKLNSKDGWQFIRQRRKNSNRREMYRGKDVHPTGERMNIWFVSQGERVRGLLGAR